MGLPQMGKTLSQYKIAQLNLFQNWQCFYTSLHDENFNSIARRPFHFLAKVFFVFNINLTNEITVFYHSLFEVFVETEYVKMKRNATAVLLRFVYLKQKSRQHKRRFSCMRVTKESASRSTKMACE